MVKIRLIIIEENKILRDGICDMLKDYDDIQIVAALCDRIKIQDKIRELKPNIMIINLGLVYQNNLEHVKSLKKEFPDLKIIIMDILPNQSEIIKFIEEGVSDFIYKNTTSKEFVNIIRSVEKGNKTIQSLLRGSLFSETADNSLNKLPYYKAFESIRMDEYEKKIIDFISQGLTDKEIATKLGLHISNVIEHREKILKKISLRKHLDSSVTNNPEVEKSNTSNVELMRAKMYKQDKTNGFSKKKTNFLKNK